MHCCWECKAFVENRREVLQNKTKKTVKTESAYAPAVPLPVHTPELKAPWPEWYLRRTSVVCTSQQWKGGGKCPLTHHAQPYADTMQPNSASEAQEVLRRVTTQPGPEDFMLEVTQQKDKSHLAARLWSTQGQSNSQRHTVERWLPEAAGGRNGGESFS